MKALATVVAAANHPQLLFGLRFGRLRFGALIWFGGAGVRADLSARLVERGQ